MKSLLYFLLMSTSFLTICQQTKLDINFIFKNSKDHDNNRKIEVKSTLYTDGNSIATLACGKNSDFILNFNVQEHNKNEVKIETEVFDGSTLTAKPLMIIAYNQRRLIEIGERRPPIQTLRNFVYL